VRGLINIQFAIQGGNVYILEVNPRASRTVPFVSKATNVPLAKIATKVMLGKTLAELGVKGDPPFHGVSVKAPVYPFNRFHGVDAVLGPEMKSTGEVMGIDASFGVAFAKAQSGQAPTCRSGAPSSSACATATSRSSCPSPAASTSWASRSSRPAARAAPSRASAFPPRTS
jgi:carbamoylphosphate synthase large subunit